MSRSATSGGTARPRASAAARRGRRDGVAEREQLRNQVGGVDVVVDERPRARRRGPARRRARRRAGCARRRQPHHELAAATGLARASDRAAMQRHQAAHELRPSPRPPCGAIERRALLHEQVEHARQDLGEMPMPLSRTARTTSPLSRAAATRCGRRRRCIGGVGEQVGHHLRQPHRIGRRRAAAAAPPPPGACCAARTAGRHLHRARDHARQSTARA